MVQRTRADLKTQITTLLADNTTGAISAADVRSVLDDVADSAYVQSSDDASDVTFIGTPNTNVELQITQLATQQTNIIGQVASLTGPTYSPRRLSPFTIDDTVIGTNGEMTLAGDYTTAATWSFASTFNNIADNTVFNLTIDNTMSTAPITINSPTNYGGMTCTHMIILPGETRKFLLAKDGSTLRITPVGPVIYEFFLTSTDITSNTSIVLSAVPSNYSSLFSVPGANVDSLLFDANVTGTTELRMEGDFTYGGSTGSFGDNTLTSGVPHVNGASVGLIAFEKSVQHIAASSLNSLARTWRYAMTGGQRTSMSLTGFALTGPRLSDPHFYFRIISKAA